MDAIKVGIRVRPVIKRYVFIRLNIEYCLFCDLREAEKALQWISNSNSIHEKGSSTPYYFGELNTLRST